MMKCFGLVVILGLSSVLGCAQNQDEVPIPDSTLLFARAAVEVGKITIAQMPEYQASVELMRRDDRTQLWLSLKKLHDGLHAPEVIANEALSGVEEGGDGDAACLPLPCSHSGASFIAQWCCALGEFRLFYANLLE